MAGNSTDNTTALIRAQMYSKIILDTIHNGYLPEGIHRDVSDFMDGSTLNVPTFGDVILRDVTEDQDRPVDALDTGSINLTITNHKGAGSYLTDEFREDSHLAAEFDNALPTKHLEALKRAYETSLLATSESMQTQADPNAINSFNHRYVASGTTDVIALEDLIYAKLVLDKAELPEEGRILIVDPIVEGTILKLANLVQVANNPKWEGLVETGMAKNMKFVKNIYDFDVYVSNRLPKLGAEAIDASTGVAAPSGSTTSPASTVVCQAMCVNDDLVSPYMGAWRRKPRTEGERNVRKGRDEFYTTARWGFAGQRPQSLVSILANAAAY